MYCGGKEGYFLYIMGIQEIKRKCEKWEKKVRNEEKLDKFKYLQYLYGLE